VIKPLFRAVTVLALVVGSVPAAAQQVALKDLPKPEKEIEDPFTLITAAIEYSGKLLVADAAETMLSLVDFADGSKVQIGRRGAGPGEYTGLLGLLRLPGDTLWVMDAQGQNAGRFVSFLPNRKPGATFPFVMMNTADSSTLTGPFYVDRRGMMYAGSLPLKIAAASGATAGSGQANVGFADSTTLVKFDPRDISSPRTKIARLRFFNAGSMKQEVAGGTNLKMTMPYMGMGIADGWAMFPDGRIAIVRGSNYAVEFILPDGRPGVKTVIPYEHHKLGESDKKLEMDAARDLMKEQMPMIKKMLPPGWTIQFDLLPPPSWPAEYPPISIIGVRAAPDGRLWVQRIVPKRIDREQWDVIDAAGKLIARWQLPPKTTIVATGDGVVYTARTDEDDLRYVQRVRLPR
jgi:hypothetical protein